VPGGRRLTGRAWDGEGAPLVLLHGLLDSSEGWDDMAVRTSRPCIALDLGGFGRSDLPAQPRIEAYADDVAAALRRLRIEDATLVGHSLGGAVAARVVERTDRATELVLLAPAGFGRIRLAEVLTLPVVVDLATLALPLALVNPLTVTAMYSTFVAHGRLPERELIARLRVRAARAPLAVRAATQAMAHAGRNVPTEIAFAGPVRALWGENDALVPCAHSEGVIRAFPQAEVEVWASMGHHPQRERPRELAEFLTREGPPPERLRRAA
jgi:pyruvate dehydrogenase E2 component (dihydrolipoamide acetyltransferase)